MNRESLENLWIVDSGFTCHVSHKEWFYMQEEPYYVGTVLMGNNGNLPGYQKSLVLSRSKCMKELQEQWQCPTYS